MSVEGENIGENAATFVPMDEVEEFEGHVFAGAREGAVDGCAVVVVDAGVLVVESAVEDPAAERLGVEHAGDEGFEFDVAVIEGFGNRALKLKLIGLKTG